MPTSSSSPYACIKVVKQIGSLSYGTCSQVQIEGVSFFPSTTIYCAKEYKGATHSKLSQFTTEKNMQKMHPSLVRCIGCTGEAPWVIIFPYYNGNTNAPYAAVATIQKELLSTYGREVDWKGIKLKARAAVGLQAI